jgi:hypothetical protein
VADGIECEVREGKCHTDEAYDYNDDEHEAEVVAEIDAGRATPVTPKTLLEVRYPALDQQQHRLIVDLIERNGGTVAGTDGTADHYEIHGCFPDHRSAFKTAQTLVNMGGIKCGLWQE